MTLTKYALTTLLETSERLREKATPGPWVTVTDLPDYGIATKNQPEFHPDPVVTKNRKYRAPWRHNYGCSEQDACLIVHAVNSLRARDEIIKVLVEALEKYKNLSCYDGSASFINDARDALVEVERIAEDVIK